MRIVDQLLGHSPSSRRKKILHGIDVRNLSGLEIGALDKPIVRRPPCRVKYLDRHSTAELREKFKSEPEVDPVKLVDVDFVVKDGSVLEAVSERFDYVVASHVFEHVPNPIAWLDEMRALLRPGGILSLVIPDRRFTFDILRPATSFGEMLEAYYTKRAKPCFADVFDQYYYWRTISAKRIAARIQNPRKMTAPSPPAENLKLALQSLEPARYEDVHCNVLTGQEFLEFFTLLRKLTLTDFVLKSFFPARLYGIEFFVQLERDRRP